STAGNCPAVIASWIAMPRPTTDVLDGRLANVACVCVPAPTPYSAPTVVSHDDCTTQSPNATTPGSVASPWMLIVTRCGCAITGPPFDGTCGNVGYAARGNAISGGGSAASPVSIVASW